MENNILKSFLPNVRATKVTYYNLDKKTIGYFRTLYAYLKAHQEKEISVLSITRAKDALKQYNTDYSRKYKAMEILSQGIKH